MAWTVEYHEAFLAELKNGPQPVRIAVVATVGFLEQFGPPLGRPYVDTLKGSAFPNMKELRITVLGGEWRVAFAFDPQRNAILLTGANKSGVKQDRFYKSLILTADRRYAEHLAKLQKAEGR